MPDDSDEAKKQAEKEEALALGRQMLDGLRRLRTDGTLSPAPKLSAEAIAKAKAVKDQRRLIKEQGQRPLKPAP